MTNEEKYKALLEFVKKYGHYSEVFGNYDLKLSYWTDLDFYPKDIETATPEDELTVYGECIHGYGEERIDVTPENIDEALEFLKKRLNKVGEFIKLLERIE